MKVLEVFEMKKSYIFEVKVCDNMFLFVEALDEYGGAIVEDFDITNIHNIYAEIVINNEEVVGLLSNINPYETIENLKIKALLELDIG